MAKQRRVGIRLNTHAINISLFEEELKYLQKLRPHQSVQDAIRNILFKDMYRENFLQLDTFLGEFSESLCQDKKRNVQTNCLLAKEDKNFLEKNAKKHHLGKRKFLFEVLKEKSISTSTSMILNDEDDFDDYLFDYSHEYKKDWSDIKVQEEFEGYSSINILTTQEEKIMLLKFSRACGIGTGKLLYEMLKRKGLFTVDFTLAEKLESSVIEIP